MIMIKSSIGIMVGLAQRQEPFPPPMRQCIAFDRGTEFAFFGTLKRSLEIESFGYRPPENVLAKQIAASAGGTRATNRLCAT